MSKNNFKFSKIFYNEKFLVIFSVVLSFIIWIIVSVSSYGPDTTTTISNVPINIQLSQSAVDDNLRVFEINNQNIANVTVKGNSLVLGALDSNSLVVTSNDSNTISQPGVYNLSLIAKPNDSNFNYSIMQDTLYPQNVTVTVDEYEEAQYNIVDNVKYKIDSNYFGSPTVFDTPIIKVSGPKTVMDKVGGVRVDYTINDTVKDTQTFNAPITIYDVDGNRLSDEDVSRLTVSNSSVNVTIPILKKATLPVKATFSNVPSGLDINSLATVTPSVIDIAGPASYIDNTNEISLEAIDFSSINLDNLSFERKVILPETCKNINNQYTATVNINIDNFDAVPVNVTNFDIINPQEGHSPTIKTSSLYVQVVGPPSEILNLQDGNVTAVVDMSKKSNVTGIVEIPVTFKIDDYSSCWVYGTYTVNVLIP